jgi:hypothetical protein
MDFKTAFSFWILDKDDETWIRAYGLRIKIA